MNNTGTIDVVGTSSKVKPTAYLVYKVLVDNNIVYVGEGRVGREKHAISGCSHVYELNKLHFEGAEVSVEIDSQHTTKSKAVKREAALIGKLQPIYNKKGKIRAALIDYIQKSKKKE